MEALTIKAIVMIIAYISLVLIPSSEACSASRKEGKPNFWNLLKTIKKFDGLKVLCLRVLILKKLKKCLFTAENDEIQFFFAQFFP